MKRNASIVYAAKRKRGKRSTYATKRASGNQLYGPGCCAHALEPETFYRAHGGRIPGDERPD